MERWVGRVAVVTGASSGIGAAIAYQLQDAGVEVVALARRSDKITEAVKAARKGAESRGRQTAYKAPSCGKLHSLKCDVSKEEDILSAFKWVKENTKGVDILVNNAGVIGGVGITENNTDGWRSILDINVLGLSICTREAVKQMRERGVDDGHIIHISSIASHLSPPAFPPIVMYFASKHAVRVLTEGLRKELVAAKSRIRVTQICPGLVKTDIFENLPMGSETVLSQPHLQSEDIADTVLYALGVPPHVQIHDLIVASVGSDV